MRLCFSRKNRTLGAIFRQHATLALLQTNHDTQKALQLTNPPAADALPVAALAMEVEEVCRQNVACTGCPAAAVHMRAPSLGSTIPSADKTVPSAVLWIAHSGAVRLHTGPDQAVDCQADDGDDVMKVEADKPVSARRSKHKYSEELKQHVISVLEAGEFDALRSAKLAQEDFLRLLAAFNKAGIHFV